MQRNKSSKGDAINSQRIKKLIQKAFIIMLIFTLALNNPYFGNVKIANAASQVIVTADYTDETITVAAGGGQSTKFYFSTDNMKSWDQIEAGKMDISTLMSTRDVIIYFKGNKDTVPFGFTIPAEDKTLKPVYSVINGTGCIQFTSTSQVQYRKGNGSWINVTSPFYTAMYESRGATLYFRTAPTVSTRAGKIINVRVPKRPNAPSVRLDTSKLYLSGMKSGVTQYRVNDNTVWLTYTSSGNINYLDLTTMLGGSLLTNTPIPAGVVEFRTPGDNKKTASAVKVIEVAAQTAIIQSMVTLNGSSLTISEPDKKKYYEYTVVSQGSTLDVAKAKWTSVSPGRTVIVPRVNVGDKLLVRVKSYTDSTTKQLVLPSTYVAMQITGITLRLK